MHICILTADYTVKPVLGSHSKKDQLGLNEIYVWFLLPTYPIFFNPTLNI